ncbi:MAG TPA: hypothetical protein VKU39_16645 [Streptosporangiaceae bacterium]|nr:hypothetical protein [Streptosporangiaceae bacterium]
MDKLSTICAARPSVLSLYLAVPADPAQLRELPARAGHLIRDCDAAVTDQEKVLAKIAALSRDWLGHGVAIFACAELRLLEVLRLPDAPPERAMVGDRPHLRPLLAALQHHPAYRVAVVDRRHVWVFAVSGDEIAAAGAEGEVVPGSGYGGWYGLEEYRVHERVIQLARRHYRESAAILAAIMRHGEPEPLVIGGHRDGVGQLFASLPSAVRDMFAGSFAADTHQLTPARVRALSDPVVTRWAELRARKVADRIAALPPGRAVTGLADCLAAVNASAAGILVVPDDGRVEGYRCGRCDALCAAACDCPDWGTAAQPVPDLIEEMIASTLADGGQVCVLPDRTGGPLAELRFPLS